MNDELRLVGFEELSASALRTRLLAAAGEFWAGASIDGDAVRALTKDPVLPTLRKLRAGPGTGPTTATPATCSASSRPTGWPSSTRSPCTPTGDGGA